jgi:hypothetical protein
VSNIKTVKIFSYPFISGGTITDTYGPRCFVRANLVCMA